MKKYMFSILALVLLSCFIGCSKKSFTESDPLDTTKHTLHGNSPADYPLGLRRMGTTNPLQKIQGEWSFEDTTWNDTLPIQIAVYWKSKAFDTLTISNVDSIIHIRPQEEELHIQGIDSLDLDSVRFIYYRDLIPFLSFTEHQDSILGEPPKFIHNPRDTSEICMSLIGVKGENARVLSIKVNKESRGTACINKLDSAFKLNLDKDTSNNSIDCVGWRILGQTEGSESTYDVIPGGINYVNWEDGFYWQNVLAADSLGYWQTTRNYTSTLSPYGSLILQRVDSSGIKTNLDTNLTGSLIADLDGVFQVFSSIRSGTQCQRQLDSMRVYHSDGTIDTLLLTPKPDSVSRRNGVLYGISGSPVCKGDTLVRYTQTTLYSYDMNGTGTKIEMFSGNISLYSGWYSKNEGKALDLATGNILPYIEFQSRIGPWNDGLGEYVRQYRLVYYNALGVVQWMEPFAENHSDNTIWVTGISRGNSRTFLTSSDTESAYAWVLSDNSRCGDVNPDPKDEWGWLNWGLSQTLPILDTPQ